MGGWLIIGDMALDSCAQCLAVAPCQGWVCQTSASESRSSVSLGACLPGSIFLMVMLGLGSVSLYGAPLSAPSLVPAKFREFFPLGRVMRVILPTGEGDVVHLFVEYGYLGF